MSGDTGLTAVFDPVEENLIVIEKLSDDNISSSVALLFEVLDIIFARGSLRMHLRIACYDNTEVIAVALLDERD